MKQTVNFYEFERAFKDCRPENFSYEGLKILFEYLEGLEDSTGTEFELDVIALCCDFSEDTLGYFLDQYDLESLEELVENTTVLIVDADQDNQKESTVIIQNY